MAYTLPDFELTLRFRPEHFTQVHREVNRQMVAQAVAWLDPQPNDRIVDLYCGIGNFALPLARRGAQVLGIDYHSGQTDQAAANAAENGLKEVARFLPCDLDARPEQARVEIAGADKVLIDPPRSGAAGPVSMLPPRGAPHRIVYVSCNPETLARDAGVLTRMKGYAFRAARLVDMFPHTRHSEAMTLFER
jgi:23S rRNA (uracil1939-C5)-methyltransferase